jgi:predicted dehydrogenase
LILYRGMTDKVYWGILGAGKVARRFAADLKLLPEARLVAVGSLSVERARSFAQELRLDRYYASYEELVADPQIDVVYVATRHSMHAPACQLALAANKAVLCEKPFALNARELQVVVALARARRQFLMEAMWTRFFPAMVRARDWVADHRIGDLRLITADFGFLADPNPTGRLFAPAWGGGALLDVGVYPVSLSSLFLGQPNRIQSMACLGTTGVDEQCGLILGHAGGRLAVLTASLQANTPREAWILGSLASIRIHCPLWKPHTISLVRDGQEPEIVHRPYEGHGYQFEASEVMRCLQQHKLESEVMPLDESLAIMGTLDTVRAQWGLQYPSERTALD